MTTPHTLKVLHVIPAVAARYGGPSRAIIEMARAILRSGASPLIVATDADGPRGRLSVALGQVFEREGIDTLLFRRDWSEAFKYSRGLGRWLECMVGAFDIVHVHSVLSYAPLAAARACQRVGVPYVVRPLGTIDPWSMALKPLRKRVFWALAGSSAVRHAAAVHYTTEGERRRAEESLRITRGVVIPHGIDSDSLDRARAAAPPGRPITAPYVLSLGRLDPKKNLESLCDAFCDLVRTPSFREWQLVIAGDGDPAYTRRLHAHASARIPRNVVFSGWLDGPSKARMIAEASLFASPSHQENFGIAAAEALVMGVPLLLSPQVELAPSVLEAGAGWVVEGTREALLAGLQSALVDTHGLAARGRAGAVFARERFSWDKIGARLVELYRQILDGCGPTGELST